MDEPEAIGMQPHSPDRIDGASVGLVAYDRMSEFGQVDPNLVFSPGLQGDFQGRHG